jgi:hypothetical protein
VFFKPLPNADDIKLATCFREPRTTQRGARRATTGPDTRHAARILRCPTQSKVRLAAAVAAICRKSEQTEPGRAIFQEDRGRCAHRTTPWGHGKIGLGIERTIAVNGKRYRAEIGHDLEASTDRYRIVDTFLTLVTRNFYHTVMLWIFIHFQNTRTLLIIVFTVKCVTLKIGTTFLKY